MKRSIRLVDDFKDVWKYSSMRVQFVAGLLLFIWSQTPVQFQTLLMDELRGLGISNRQIALSAAVIWLLANIGSRITKYEKVKDETDKSSD